MIATASVKPTEPLSNGTTRHDQLPNAKLMPSHPAKPQTNGDTNDSSASKSSDILPATHLLAQFTTTAKLSTVLTPEIITKLKEVILDYLGVVASGATTAPSSTPIYNAILTLGATAVPNDTDSGSTVLTKGAKRFTRQHAALLNATFGHSLDFDDTYADGTLHAGVTVISAALAEVESSTQQPPPSTRDFLTSIALGYEVTCRLGRELGFEAYSRGFHNTSVAGIFGAVSTIAYLRKLDTHTIDMAYGLAGSKAAGSMQYLENGSWNKRLHPGFAAHDAFVCVALAEAGVVGAERIVEGKLGTLMAYSPKQNKSLERLVGGLGTEWVWLRSSLKPWPACRMTHGFIELAGRMGVKDRGAQGGAGIDTVADAARVTAADVEKIELRLSKSNMILVGEPQPNKIHPENIVDAQFSAYFQTANALLYGAGFDVSAYTRMDDSGIREVSEKILCVVDDERYKGFMGGSVKVTWSDGKIEEGELKEPLGEISHPFEREHVQGKFMALMEPVYGKEKAEEVLRRVEALGEDGKDEGVSGLMKLLG